MNKDVRDTAIILSLYVFALIGLSWTMMKLAELFVYLIKDLV